MEVTIGDDNGITMRFCGCLIEIKTVHEGMLSISEARMAADALRLMADHLEASEDGN